ncbi:YrhC family protein [Heyndrickxia ginsengihumi]|uniref:YrhC-like protein n=1 Tax=Heyndrickxia ginsengihumi TaxID=363870 RepID=A0A0A6VF10_9BACI|nr:YrhC family protein [Heyndrickxia ginsengihumi]KHD86820.1 hypothetical protein NG54_00055 [Heyndrickxia ginsengihumi]MBE6183711.1 hypothetical protein [Bacillus sp. (in: firmicutes)]MCM3021812.1 YrhC family protein [Heyndrickxia ginsengihumi]NEY19746.1 hypothetical protein [Heyndrickxia ginsengihumi]
MRKAKELYGKMMDFKIYAFITLAVTGFIYLGAVLPVEGKTEKMTEIMMTGNIVFIGIAALFFFLSRKYYEELQQSEEGLQLLEERLDQR